MWSGWPQGRLPSAEHGSRHIAHICPGSESVIQVCPGPESVGVVEDSVRVVTGPELKLRSSGGDSVVLLRFQEEGRLCDLTILLLLRSTVGPDISLDAITEGESSKKNELTKNRPARLGENEV